MKPIAQKIKGKLWVHLNGRTFSIADENKNFGSGSGKKTHSGEVLAPMPGKITKVFKSVGEVVAVGDVVLMMEAMKMEYTLKADANGTLDQVLCKVGDQVQLGKLLAKIKTGEA